MFKFIKGILTIILLLCVVFAGVFIIDKHYLRNDVLRLHVVANSDSAEDQMVKLHVKDALLAYFESSMADITDAQSAKAFLKENLSELEEVANRALISLGVTDVAKVSLTQEAFDIRQYDTFALPAGIYEALRVEIGEAAGKNWWCVAFPSLCAGATTEEFKATAISSGMGAGLSNALAGDKGYEIRFLLLDWFGKIENLISKK